MSANRYLKPYLLPLAFVVINLVLKFWFINAVWVDYDDPFSIFYSQMDISAMYSDFFKVGNNPLFFESILHFWTKLFGISPLAVRVPSIIFSSFTVYFIYKIGYKHFNIKVACIASLIFTVSNYHLQFSHEARTYAMFAFFTTISIYRFLELLQNPQKKRNILFLSIINTFLIYSHCFALFIPFVQILLCLCRKEMRKRVLKPYLYSCIIPALAYLPMLWVMVDRFLIVANEGTWLGPEDFSGLFYRLADFSNSRPGFFLFVLILLSASIKYLIKKGTKVPDKNAVIIYTFVIPFFMMFGVSLKYLPHNIPMFLDRYVIHTSIPFFILAALALNYLIDGLSKRSICYSLYALFCILMLISFRPPKDRYKMQEVLAKVQEYRTPNSLIYIIPEYSLLNFVYNYDRSYFEKVDNQDPFGKLKQNLEKENILAGFNIFGIPDNFRSDNNRVIFINLGSIDKTVSEEIIDSLKTGAVNMQEFQITNTRKVWIFDYPKK